MAILEPDRVWPTSGWLLVLHPDFLRGHTLSQKITEYGFFEYAINKALLLFKNKTNQTPLAYR